MHVLDLNGREVRLPMRHEANSSTLDIHALAAGTYALRMVTETGVQTARFMKVE